MSKRVFFSFHYQDILDFRANVVRKHWLTKGGAEEAGYFDASLWESTKRQGNDALKRLINSGLDHTSVTCVLIGSYTYSRPWVRYEILKSLKRGNKLIGIHINGIADQNKHIKPLGPNPLDYLGIFYSTDGRTISLWEWQQNNWIPYREIDGSENCPITTAPNEFRGHGYKLSDFCTAYDWISHNGYGNFENWIQ